MPRRWQETQTSLFYTNFRLLRAILKNTQLSWTVDRAVLKVRQHLFVYRSPPYLGCFHLCHIKAQESNEVSSDVVVSSAPFFLRHYDLEIFAADSHGASYWADRRYGLSSVWILGNWCGGQEMIKFPWCCVLLSSLLLHQKQLPASQARVGPISTRSHWKRKNTFWFTK